MRLGFIGCGHMNGAIIEGVIKSGLECEIYVSSLETNEFNLFVYELWRSVPEVADIVLSRTVAFKPTDLAMLSTSESIVELSEVNT